MITKLAIRQRTPDDDQQIVDLRNRLDSDFPPGTVDDLRFRIASRPEWARDERWVAEYEDMMVGNLVISEQVFAKRPNLFDVMIRVDPDHRRQGIGSQLAELMEERMLEHRADRLYVEIREDQPQAQQFALRRGFHLTGHAEQMSRLDVHCANLEGYEGLEERLLQDGIRIATLAELGVDNQDVLHGLHELDNNTSRDVPSSEEWSAVPFDIWRRHMDSPSFRADAYWIALDGDRPIGLACLDVPGTNAAFNDYTCTDCAYRGRGVARALKLRTIEWSRQNGIDTIFTGNHVDNQRMLAINVRLGYQKLPRWLEMARDQTQP